MLRGVEGRVRRWLFGRDFSLWYAPEYRLPLSHLEARTGFDPRRSAYALWYLLDRGAVALRDLRMPRKAEYSELARVHSPELLDSLSRAETAARVWSVDPSDVPVDEVMTTVRLACGATIDAAREMAAPSPRAVGRRALNLLGGFHHAKPDVAGGFCPVNDLAVAIAALRAEGFSGRVLVLDLDAHPPDGTAACLERDPSHWIGSISGADWGPMGNVDETVLPEHAGDEPYLRALEALLARMPPGDLAFVVAGGDVLFGDQLGNLGLSLAGCRERDLRVADALSRVPSVWLPAGGYGRDGWRALAGTGLALATRSRAPIPARYDPLRARFSAIARSILPADLGEEIDEDVGLGSTRRKLFLEFYSAEGLEHALHRYGVLTELGRLGYGPFQVEIQREGVGQSARVIDLPSGQALIELVAEKRRIGGAEMLYVHWLALRHPRARFSQERPQLPGQDVPGLGMAKEISALLLRMAMRLGLEGIALRPAAYHLAYNGRQLLRFLDPARQGRFEALVRDLAGLSLTDATRAVSQGRVLLEGAPYRWEPDEMVQWINPRPDEREAIEKEKQRVRFRIS
ncbi:MAG: histone deacetylase [Deltaproteobacteria bacterium]|nr:MAG: histone deacetylase [Deltaproteobacteria bacterium]